MIEKIEHVTHGMEGIPDPIQVTTLWTKDINESDEQAVREGKKTWFYEGALVDALLSAADMARVTQYVQSLENNFTPPDHE